MVQAHSEDDQSRHGAGGARASPTILGVCGQHVRIGQLEPISDKRKPDTFSGQRCGRKSVRKMPCSGYLETGRLLDIEQGQSSDVAREPIGGLGQGETNFSTDGLTPSSVLQICYRSYIEAHPHDAHCNSY
jgi:hypothetical protein